MDNQHVPTLAKEYRNLYTGLAKDYDKMTNMLRFLGARVNTYRREAVKALQLKPGSSILDLACGTGPSFPFLEEVIGEQGRIVALDITPAMLAKAREKIEKYGWKNIELIEADANKWETDERFDGVLCCHALCLMPRYREITQQLVKMLNVGGRLVVMDVYDGNTNSIMFRLIAKLLKHAYHPVEDAKTGPSRRSYLEMRKYLQDVQVKPIYFDLFYIASGIKYQDGRGGVNITQG